METLKKLKGLISLEKCGLRDCFAFVQRKNPFKEGSPQLKHSKIPDSEYDVDFNGNDEYFEEWPANNMLKDIHGNDI